MRTGAFISWREKMKNKKNKKYIEFKTPEEYYEFFNKIPENQWITTAYWYDGRMCAIGHLTGGEADRPQHPFRKILSFGVFDDSTDINDGTGMYRELGDTPKERILNALILKIAGVWDELSD